MTTRFVAAVVLTLSGSDLAWGQDPIRLVDDIERRLEGNFIFTTAGDGAYVIYQRVENRRGLLEGAEVICLAPHCYVRIAEASEADMRRAGEGNIETVRRRFRSARDAYMRLQRAPLDELPGSTKAWRDAGEAIGTCLRDERAC